MLYLTKEKKKLLVRHIEIVVDNAPAKVACLSTASIAITLASLPDNHKLLQMELGDKQLSALLDLASTWLNESMAKEKADESPK